MSAAHACLFSWVRHDSALVLQSLECLMITLVQEKKGNGDLRDEVVFGVSPTLSVIKNLW